MEGGKPDNPEKNPRSKGENQQQTQPTGRNRKRATYVGGERSHHCAIPSQSQAFKVKFKSFHQFPSVLDFAISLEDGGRHCKSKFVFLRLLHEGNLPEATLVVTRSDSNLLLQCHPGYQQSSGATQTIILFCFRLFV